MIIPLLENRIQSLRKMMGAQSILLVLEIRPSMILFREARAGKYPGSDELEESPFPVEQVI